MVNASVQMHLAQFLGLADNAGIIAAYNHVCMGADVRTKHAMSRESLR